LVKQYRRIALILLESKQIKPGNFSSLVFFAECSISVPLDVNPGKQIVELLERVF
jgi:hypothetical protein